MPKTTISLKNIAVPSAVVSIRDLEASVVPIAATILVSEKNSYDRIMWSADLYDAINTDKIVILIDGVEQSKSDSLIFMQSATQTGKPLGTAVSDNTSAISALELNQFRQRTVINIVDCTAAPPTTVLGDRYIIDDTAGTVNAGWSGAAKNDIVEYDGANWIAHTPEEGWVSYIDAQNKDAKYVDDGVGLWELVATIQPATETIAGVVELGTQPEVNNGVDPNKAVTSATLENKTYGTFTGSIISDNALLKTILQELESEIEANKINEYGQISMQANSTQTNIVSSNTPVKIAGTTTAGLSSVGITISNNRITNSSSTTRVFKATICGTVIRTFGGNRDCTGYIALNGSVLPDSAIQMAVNNQERTIPVQCLITLAPGEYAEAFIENNSNTLDVVVEYLNLIVTNIT